MEQGGGAWWVTRERGVGRESRKSVTDVRADPGNAEVEGPRRAQWADPYLFSAWGGGPTSVLQGRLGGPRRPGRVSAPRPQHET